MILYSETVAQAGRKRMDERLVRRHTFMNRRAAKEPGASLPKMFPLDADLEQTYDFFSNPRVKPGQVLAPHVKRTVKRCEQAGRVLIISDGTEFKFSGEREGLGPVTGGRGFFGHFSIAIDNPRERQMLGVVEACFWTREDKPKGEKKARKGHPERLEKEHKESDVWMDNILAVETSLAGSAQALHVLDSGGDDFQQFSSLDVIGTQFNMRLKHHDRLLDEKHAGRTIRAELELQAPTLLKRKVLLAPRAEAEEPKRRRTHPARSERWADLRVSVATVTIPRPLPASAHQGQQESVTLNVVRVFEPDPPEGEPRVEWLLATNLPIKTLSDICFVVDSYRARWVIEEYFRALKSGCNIKSRQLCSAHSLMNMVAWFASLASNLLGLRDAARHQPDRKASEILSDVELRVLHHISVLPISKDPTCREAYLAIAKIGGHQKRNGDPGWTVLAKGYLELTTVANYQRKLDAEAQKR